MLLDLLFKFSSTLPVNKKSKNIALLNFLSIGAPRREDIRVTAYSPFGRSLECPLTTIDGTNSATFKPDEAGEWRIEITYQGKQIQVSNCLNNFRVTFFKLLARCFLQGGPYTCSVFDPDGVELLGLEGALPLVPHTIDVDCRDVGVPGEVFADIVHDKKSVRSRLEKVDKAGFLYKIHFTPTSAGKHRVSHNQ